MIKNELSELMSTRGWSQSQIARAIGKSPAVINQYLQDKYQGNTTALEEDIRQLLNRETEKSRSQKLIACFVPTVTARRALDVSGSGIRSLRIV